MIILSYKKVKLLTTIKIKTSIKKKLKLSPKQKENLETNFRKLWLMEKVHGPFMVHVAKIRKDWDLPIKGGRKKAWRNIKTFYRNLYSRDEAYFDSDEFKLIAPIINSMAVPKLPKLAKKKIFTNLLYNLPSLKFKREARELRKRFGFEKFWHFPLIQHLITGEIYAPYEAKSKAFFSKQVPEHVVKEDWKIFNLMCKKEAQHDFLKKRGLKAKEIAELEDHTNKLPSPLIYSNLNIAQLVWGDWDDLDKDKKRINLVKKRYQRFKKYFVSLNESDMNILKNLSSSSEKQ